ncbi:MAG: helix-turn-helix domain-containing protein [Erysipelotrichaceae bacterium]
MLKYEAINVDQETQVRIVSFKNDASLRFFSMHWHNSTELLYCRGGSLEVRIKEAQFIMKKGDLIYINSNIPHETRSNEPNDVVMIQFKKLFYDRQSFDIDLNTTINKLDSQLKVETIHLIEHCEKIYLEKKQHYTLQLNSILFSLKYSLLEYFGKKHHNPNYSSSLVMVLEASLHYIEENYQYNISVAEIAEQSGYSLSYFSRNFKEFLGISCWHYLQNRRLQAALKMLSSTNKSILEVAIEAGFPNIKSLRKSLYYDAKMTPSEYKALLKK